MNKKVLLINLGWEQQTYIETLYHQGFQLYGIHAEKVNDDRFIDILVTDYFNVESIVKFAKDNLIDLVITDQCDYALYAASIVNEALGLTGILPQQALLTTNKLLQRNWLNECNENILQPSYQLCLSTIDIKKFAEKHGYPVIVKPSDSRGSFGVVKVTNESEIKEAFVYAISNSYARQVIAEQFIDGVQVTVDGYCDPEIGPISLAIATKTMLDSSPVAVEIHYKQWNNKRLYSEIKKNNEKIAKALGINFGFIHAEYMVKDNKPYLIEMANRGGGCYTSTHILSNIVKDNMPQRLINDVMNKKNMPISSDANNEVSLVFFKIASDDDIIKDIYIDESISKIDQFITYRVMIKKGDRIRKVFNDAERHGFFIIKGKYDQTLLDKILNKINVCLEYSGFCISPVVY